MADQGLPVVHTFEIDTELVGNMLSTFPKFVSEHVAFGSMPGLRMTQMTAVKSPQGTYMEFMAGPDPGDYQALVRLHLGKVIKVEVRSDKGTNEEFNKQLDNVLLMIVQFFEEDARKSLLYLAFVPGSKRTAELRRPNSIIRSIFSGNMINLFLLSILIGVFIFVLIPKYAPIFFIALMLGLVMSAGKVSAIGSPWRITKKNREVVLVQHTVPEGEMQAYVEQYRDKIAEAKRKAYELFLDCPHLVCADKISDVFNRAGVPSKPEDFLVRRIDVYSIVERVSKKFNLTVPAIVISQDPRPNAAATGFTRGLGTMIITMGLLTQLDEEEIEVVVGHEVSHLKAGDPIALFTLIGIEYLWRVYILFPLWPPIQQVWLPYLIGVFWLIFFFGKFLESRADLESGIILGKPKVMADSLKKIGFRRLLLTERFLEPNVSRFGEWLRFDPHPPLYFRIKRLEELDLSNPPRHTFLSSVRAVFSGIAHSGKTV